MKTLEIIAFVTFIVSIVLFWNIGSGWFLSLAVLSFIGSVQAYNSHDMNRRGEF